MSEKNFLASLKNNPESINRALSILAARIRNSPGDAEEANNALDTLRQAFDSELGLDDVERTRLASYDKWSEENYLPDLLDKLTAQITDFASASRAVAAFDIAWFASLPVSNEGKQTLAANLLQLTRQYAGNYNSFWQTLVDGNTDTLGDVSFNILRDNEEDEG